MFTITSSCPLHYTTSDYPHNRSHSSSMQIGFCHKHHIRDWSAWLQSVLSRVCPFCVDKGFFWLWKPAVTDLHVKEVENIFYIFEGYGYLILGIYITHKSNFSGQKHVPILQKCESYEIVYSLFQNIRKYRSIPFALIFTSFLHFSASLNHTLQSKLRTSVMNQTPRTEINSAIFNTFVSLHGDFITTFIFLLKPWRRYAN